MQPTETLQNTPSHGRRHPGTFTADCCDGRKRTYRSRDPRFLARDSRLRSVAMEPLRVRGHVLLLLLLRELT